MTSKPGPTGGLTIGGESWAGVSGNVAGPEQPDGQKESLALNPAAPEKYPRVPSCCPVSKKTPTPPRTTVSAPGSFRTTYAAPMRGAKLYQDVRQRGVPCGASARVPGLPISPWTVKGRFPSRALGAGFTSQRKPRERLHRGLALHSSWTKAEKLRKFGNAGAVDCANAKSALFAFSESWLK